MDGVYEHSYVPTWETGVDDYIKHTYLAVIKVRENETVKQLPIYYKIPKARLPEWDNRVSDPAPYSTINGSSKGVYILGELEIGYITLKVDTTYSTSSLSQGTWYWELVYYTKRPPGPGGGGGGAGAAPIIIRPIQFEVYPEKFDIIIGTGIETQVDILFYNREEEPVFVQVRFEGDTEVVSTDFKLTKVDGLSNITIPIKIKGYKEPVDKKAIVVISVKKELIETIKEVPIFVRTIPLGTKKLGEKCYANEECESNNCVEGVCQPPEVKKVPKIPTYYYYIVALIIIAIIFYALRKRK